MVQSALPVFPRWLVIGVLIGLAVAAVFAVIFVIGMRWYPDREPDHRTSTRTTGEDRKRAEIRHYLGLIGEPFEEKGVVAGERVDFWLPSRRVAITFNALTYYRLADSSVIPILVEHEMPISHLGARLPFDVPPIGFGASEGRNMSGNGQSFSPVTTSRAAAFAEFDLPPDASLDELKSAYRDRILKAHPDHGGDPETFARVRDAYRVARGSMDGDGQGASTTS